ncbi:patatin-like protein [Gordonia sp. TBRC 11910]|uniref:Patatin-like protein n=1 Tax=Gordonia asplenii TaxID=2725283 RepID=A0A848KZS9_9ACTN|nr:patatin-like protein [Gordonia asplenii]NMO04220.1 patatin-like protein [Gordonia asplenii]
MSENPERHIELRLAVVCYGGVALAIYMHGVTKELHKLVEASRQVEKGGPNEFDADDTARAYYDVLAAYRDQGTPLRVVIDVISGTSAGGINGVVLGKAIARGADQQKLRDLWLNDADLRKLLRPNLHIGLWPGVAVSLAWQLINVRRRTSPLSGAFLARKLYDALRSMDDGAGDSLLIDNDSLDLYVTTTDLTGADRPMSDGAGGISQRSTDFARAIKFSATAGPGEFGADWTPALTFAARATSSFPGAFAPVSLRSIADEVDFAEQHVVFDPTTVHFTTDYRETSVDAVDVWFVDGGLLDNAPFDHAVAAIARKPAESQVVRRLGYIEPDPGIALLAPARANTPTAPAAAPRWVNGVFKAIIGAKGSHSFLPDLIEIREMNNEIQQIGAIIEAQEGLVRDKLVELGLQVGTDLLTVQNEDSGTSVEFRGASATPTKIDGSPVTAATATVGVPAAVAEFADKTNASVPAWIGVGYPTYVRLKATSAVDYLSSAIGGRVGYVDGSNAADFLQTTLREWLKTSPDWSPTTPSGLAALLKNLDMPYRERRLQFVLMAINDLYADPAQPVRATELDDLKGEAWRAFSEIRQVTVDAVGKLHDQNLFDFLPEPTSDPKSFPIPDRFAAENSAKFAAIVSQFCTIIGGGPGHYSNVLWNRYVPKTAHWPTTARQTLLTRYLGFPLWDATIYPSTALSNLPMYSPLKVEAFSPEAARALRPAPGTQKLQGAGFFHFGGFLKRAWRENDYLWGRLDTVERILAIVDDAAAEDAQNHPSIVAMPTDPAQRISLSLKAGLGAVLRSESGLTKVRRLRELLTAQIDGDGRSTGPNNAK